MLVKPVPAALPSKLVFCTPPAPKSEPAPQAFTRSVADEKLAYTHQMVRGPPGGAGPGPPTGSANTERPVIVALAAADMISAPPRPAKADTVFTFIVGPFFLLSL